MTSDRSAKNKRWIRPLPERLVNKIAAGEVIERPAAVLKELVENSLDAGATNIEIIIEKSGTKLISVTDNGCGIEPEQVEVAFSRHATSKINDFSDLEKLQSFGFRGEALPSIASVSRTIMITKTATAENGMRIVIEGGVHQSLKPVAAPIGTKIEVENLFFNTPARRKFLKAETTEARHLSRNAIAMAMSAPKVRFTYTLNERKLFSLDDQNSNPGARIGILLFGDSNIHFYELSSEASDMNISGYLTFAENCRQNQYGLYLFINNRHIKSQSLTHAVISGYGELLPRGHFPAGAVFLNIDPLKVDVNVHPTKAEVRLSEEKMVHDLLYQAVKKSVRGASYIPSADFHGKTNTALPTRDFPRSADHSEFQVAHGQSLSVPEIMNQLYGPDSRNPDKPQTQEAFPLSSQPPHMAVMQVETPVETDSPAPHDAIYLGQFGDLYLLFKTLDEILIIDQHAAHERILYEETLQIIDKGNGISQSLLFPVNLELSIERFSLFEEYSEIFKAIGFDISPFGPSAVLLSAVPSILARRSPEKIFLSILDDIETSDRTGDDMKKGIAQSIACRAAVMAGDKLNGEEATALFGRLMSCQNRQTCPHGRPFILKIPRSELDVKFGRK